MNICIVLLLSITGVAFLCTVALFACSLLPCVSLNDRLQRTLNQTTFMMLMIALVAFLLSSLIQFLV